MNDTSPWHNKKILIVDDSALIRNQLRTLYASLGLEIVGEAGDGLAAIEKFKDVRPDIVSLDIIMPYMHGFDCHRKLKKLDANLHTVFVSCLAHEAITSELLQEEFNPNLFATKPATLESLEKVLSFCLGVPIEQPSLGDVSPAARVPSVS
ncbi:MAG: response regulator [Bdellovibrionota bacterium]